jgi:hypothetical protein
MEQAKDKKNKQGISRCTERVKEERNMTERNQIMKYMDKVMIDLFNVHDL